MRKMAADTLHHGDAQIPVYHGIFQHGRTANIPQYKNHRASHGMGDNDDQIFCISRQT